MDLDERLVKLRKLVADAQNLCVDVDPHVIREIEYLEDTLLHEQLLPRLKDECPILSRPYQISVSCFPGTRPSVSMEYFGNNHQLAKASTLEISHYLLDQFGLNSICNDVCDYFDDQVEKFIDDAVERLKNFVIIDGRRYVSDYAESHGFTFFDRLAQRVAEGVPYYIEHPFDDYIGDSPYNDTRGLYAFLDSLIDDRIREVLSFCSKLGSGKVQTVAELRTTIKDRFIGLLSKSFDPDNPYQDEAEPVEEKWVNLLYQREQDWDPILWLTIPKEKYLENQAVFKTLTLPVITEMEKASNSLPTMEESIVKEKDPLKKANLERQVELLEEAGVFLKEVEDDLSVDVARSLEPMTADYLEKTLMKIQLGRPPEEM